MSQTQAAEPLLQPVPGAARASWRDSTGGKSLVSSVVWWIGISLAAMVVVFLLLLTAGPVLLPYRTLTVYTGSMEPAIHTGSVIIVVPVKAEEVRPGDVITFQKPNSPGQFVTHRVIDVHTAAAGVSWTTKGDANGTEDGWRVRASGTGYRYWFSIPHVGYLLAWLQSRPGRVMFLIIPAAALAILTLYELWKPARAVPES